MVVVVVAAACVRACLGRRLGQEQRAPLKSSLGPVRVVCVRPVRRSHGSAPLLSQPQKSAPKPHTRRAQPPVGAGVGLSEGSGLGAWLTVGAGEGWGEAEGWGVPVGAWVGGSVGRRVLPGVEPSVKAPEFIINSKKKIGPSVRELAWRVVA